MKIAIDTGPVKGAKLFGIGLNTQYLTASLLKEAKKRKNIQVEYYRNDNNELVAINIE